MSEALGAAMRLQDGLINRATGGFFDEQGDDVYFFIRREFLDDPSTKALLPSFVLQCRTVEHFWNWIKYEKPTYAERRTLIWEAFQPLIDYLEGSDRTPSDLPIGIVLKQFDADHVHAVWQKALERRITDPEGAITAARALLETTCKHVLDAKGVNYNDDADLPKLWALASQQISLAPSQHQEEVFKAILGNCQSVVNYLGTIRNRVGDAHGKGRNPVKPKERHAALAVNLAGTMAAFMASTWSETNIGENP